jgi:hypothetical protein
LPSNEVYLPIPPSKILPRYYCFPLYGLLLLLLLSSSSSLLFNEGPRSKCYGRTAALKALLFNPMTKMMKFFLLFHFNGAPVE